MNVHQIITKTVPPPLKPIVLQFAGFAGHIRRVVRERRSIRGDNLETAFWSITYIRKFAFQRMQRLLQGIATRLSSAAVSSKLASEADVDPRPRIAALVTGGIGDYVVIARFLRDLAANVEPFHIDIFCSNQDAADWLFASVPGFGGAYSEFLFNSQQVVDAYTTSVRINQFIVVHTERLRWQKFRSAKKLSKVIDRIVKYRSKIEVFVQQHPYMDNFLAEKIVFSGQNRENFLHEMAGITYTGSALDFETDEGAIERFGLSGRNYITVNNGFDTDFVISGKTATKCYPHYDELIRLFKTNFPGIMVVQVGAKNSTPIKSADLNLIAKTNLREVSAILKQSQLHIDNEGGLVHIAKALSKKSCVIFGPTSPDYFAYSDNINIRPAFCGSCWWITRTWMDVCARGFDEPRCLSDQPPSHVMTAISNEYPGPGPRPEASQG